MKVADIDFDNILLDKKSYKTYENILIYDIPHKTFMDTKPLRIGFIDLLKFMTELDI